MIHILELEFLIITTLLVEVTDGGLVLITMVFCLELLDLVSPQYKQPPISPKYCDFSVESQVGHTLCPSMPYYNYLTYFRKDFTITKGTFYPFINVNNDTIILFSVLCLMIFIFLGISVLLNMLSQIFVFVLVKSYKFKQRLQ